MALLTILAPLRGGGHGSPLLLMRRNVWRALLDILAASCLVKPSISGDGTRVIVNVVWEAMGILGRLFSVFSLLPLFVPD